jgi:MarR family 2-MHQ and catechol resistance regulon transcriptional repressor
MATKPQQTGVHLWLVLMKAFHAIFAHATAGLAETGLGDSDFRVLEALLHKGPLPVNTIGPKVHLTPGSISVAVDRLYAKGLVSREESSEDRRVRVVALTAKGRALITKVFSDHSAAIERVAATLSEKERAQLTEGLKKIGKYAATLPPPGRSSRTR